jgi:lactam utilization protein B
MENVRIVICEHTGKPVVQERFDKEWICIHGDTDQEDMELVNKIKSEIDGRVQ